MSRKRVQETSESPLRIEPFGEGGWTVAFEPTSMPGWSCELDLVPGGGVAGLRIGSVTGALITSRELRSFRLGDVEREARARVRAVERFARPHLGVVMNDLTGVEERKSGRPRRSDLAYAHVAQIYVDALERGDAPIPAVAEGLVVSRATARNMVSEARERTLLTGPPMKRRAGGELTPRAFALLEDA